MERLTIEYCGEYVPKDMCSIDRLGGADDCDLCREYCKAEEERNNDCRGCVINQCFNKLGEYEDLEEQTGIEIHKLYSSLMEYIKNRDNIDPKDTCFTLLTREESGQYYKWLELYEQEKLLELPCAVGDTVWDNDFGHSYSYTVTGFSSGKIGDGEEDGIEGLRMHYKNGSGSLRCSCAVIEIGKTVFLTREEAESALKELQGREGNGK